MVHVSSLVVSSPLIELVFHNGSRAFAFYVSEVQKEIMALTDGQEFWLGYVIELDANRLLLQRENDSHVFYQDEVSLLRLVPLVKFSLD